MTDIYLVSVSYVSVFSKFKGLSKLGCNYNTVFQLDVIIRYVLHESTTVQHESNS